MTARQFNMRGLLALVLFASFMVIAAGQAMAQTTVLRDLAYGPDSAQRMDVHIPAGARNAPVIFMVHGGAWRFGDKANDNVVSNKVAHWLPKGYIFISINTRLMPDANPVEQAEDVAKALAFAQDQAPSWGADPKRFVLMGHSAGAHLVAMLASDPAIILRQKGQPWLGTIALDSAVFDVTAIMEKRHLRLYDRAFGDDKSFWQQASPLYRLAAAPQPMLLVCSSRRDLSCAQAQNYTDKAISLGGRMQILPVAKSHGEINKELGQPGPYTESVDHFLRSLGLP